MYITLTSATDRKCPKMKPFVMTKRAVIFWLLFLLVYRLPLACCTNLADSSTCGTPSESDFNDTSNHCGKF